MNLHNGDTTKEHIRIWLCEDPLPYSYAYIYNPYASTPNKVSLHLYYINFPKLFEVFLNVPFNHRCVIWATPHHCFERFLSFVIGICT